MLKIVIATTLGCLLWIGIIAAVDGTDSTWLGLALPLGYLTGLAVRLTLAARRNRPAAPATGHAKGAAKVRTKTGGKGRPTHKNPRR